MGPQWTSRGMLRVGLSDNPLPVSPELQAAEILSEAERIHNWKLEQARTLGYDGPEAERIAEFGLDLHELEDLLARGCPRELAVWILAP